MSKKIELMVREVRRYVVTMYSKEEGHAAKVEPICEIPNLERAREVAGLISKACDGTFFDPLSARSDVTERQLLLHSIPDLEQVVASGDFEKWSANQSQEIKKMLRSPLYEDTLHCIKLYKESLAQEQ